MTAAAKLTNAIALSKAVKAKTLEPRRRPRPKPQECSKARGAAVAAARRHHSILWTAAGELEGQTIDGEVITLGKVRGLQRLVDALCAMHRQEVERTAQHACVIAAPHKGNDGLERLAKYKEGQVRAYLALLARARLILYQPGRVGTVSLVGFPVLFGGSERARAWCGARLFAVAGSRTKESLRLTGWWRPMLQALMDGSSADQAAELLERYRKAYEDRERARKEDAHAVISHRTAKKLARLRGEAKANEPRPQPMLSPALVAALDDPTRREEARAALQAHRKPKTPQDRAQELEHMARGTAIDHVIAKAAARRQPSASKSQFLGGNSRRGMLSHPSRSLRSEDENGRPQPPETLRSAPLSPPGSPSTSTPSAAERERAQAPPASPRPPTPPHDVATTPATADPRPVPEGRLDRGKVARDPPDVLGARPSAVELMLRAGGLIDRKELERIENALERERNGVVLQFPTPTPPKGGAS